MATTQPGEAPDVLIVEDNELDRELLHAHLRGGDFITEFARDGLEAWQLLDSDPDRFDVVLLDRSMPRVSGLELLALMKQDVRCRAIPVILQTAHVDRQGMIEGIRAGAYYYLTKPYDGEVLRTVVHTAARDRAEMRRLQTRVRRGLTALSLMTTASFTLRTIVEAQDLGAVLAGACPDPDSAVIGLTELLVNAVEHGNLGITYEEKSQLTSREEWNAEVARRLALAENAAKRVYVRVERSADDLQFTISDAGNGFDWKRFLEVDPGRAFDTHGRGILLARHLSFHALEYRGAGNEVCATIRLHSPDRPA